MGIDLREDYDFLTSRIKAIDTYNEVSRSSAELTNQQQSSFEKSQEATLSPLSNLSEQRKRYQRQVSTQLTKLLDIDKMIPEDRFTGKTSSSVASFVKDSFSEALDEIKSKIPQIVADEMLKQLGCSQEQTYDVAVLNNQQGIFIPLESIDLWGFLKEEPNSPFGKLFYEKNPISIQSKPFSMNREIYKRVQNQGISYSNDNGSDYRGTSQQNLFDFTFVNQDQQGNQGNFLQVKLYNRQGGQNLVGEFVTDYLKSIDLVDTKGIYLQLLNALFGAVSINLNAGVGNVRDTSYFQRIIQRILGLCFDNREEIDVSGIAKVAPLDGIEDSFFELTDVDLRIIESNISNIKQGVFEYVECTTIKQPFNTNEVFDSLLNILQIDETNTADSTAILDSTLQSIKDNTLGPKFALGVAIDDSIVQRFPEAIYAALISPKVLLPMMIMTKALEATQNNIQNSIVNEVYNLESFMRTFKKFNIELVSKIGAEFVQILYNIIQRDIRKLTRKIFRDLRKEQSRKKLLQTKSLLALGIIFTKIVPDFRKCKSVVDRLIEIIELSLQGTRFATPQSALIFADLRSGFSDTRAMLEVIEEFQKLGLPTGPMPDGSPNLWVLSVNAQIKGVEAERTKNSKTQQLIPALKVSPAYFTFPQTNSGVVS
jgi:hypothetical protein